MSHVYAYWFGIFMGGIAAGVATGVRRRWLAVVITAILGALGGLFVLLVFSQ